MKIQKIASTDTPKEKEATMNSENETVNDPNMDQVGDQDNNVRNG